MSTSVVFARGLMAELSSRSLDPHTLLRACDIDQARVASWREMLSEQELERLTRNAIELTDDPGLGLSMGTNAPHNMLQLYGHLMLAQPTLRHAIAVLRRYAGLLGDQFFWRISESDDKVVLTFSLDVVSADAARVGVDYALAMATKLYKHFTRRHAALHAVQLRHARPVYAGRYAEVFRCPVEFDHFRNALVFARVDLDRTQCHADALLEAALRRATDKALDEGRVVKELGRQLAEMLVSEHDLADLRPEHVAHQLGLSARRLRRRLHKEGTTFKRVVDSARCRIACHELMRDDATVHRTARLLGYSEASAFHRAFRRWTGRTPKQFVRAAPDAETPA